MTGAHRAGPAANLLSSHVRAQTAQGIARPAAHPRDLACEARDLVLDSPYAILIGKYTRILVEIEPESVIIRQYRPDGNTFGPGSRRDRLG